MIVLITGASSGIGKTCAEHLISKGYKVYGTSRKAKFPPEGHMIQMDVRDDDSVRKCIQRDIRPHILKVKKDKLLFYLKHEKVDDEIKKPRTGGVFEVISDRI